MNRSPSRNHFVVRPAKQLGLFCALAVASASVARAQVNYWLQTGAPTFTTPSPVEMGFINLANGNLHLEIPLGSFPQRGRIGLSAKLVYDSLIWEVFTNGSSSWWAPTSNAPNFWGGWRFITTADGGTVTPTTAQYSCGTSYYNTYSPFTWTAPDGTQHVFPITTQYAYSGCGPSQIPSADAFAEDSTGYHMYVTNYTQAVVYAADGTIVHDDTQTVGLATVVTTYDFSNTCPGCDGSAYIRKLSETSSLPTFWNTLNKQTQYTYDSPQNGNITAIKEWNYYTGSPPASPDRETDFTYPTSSAYTGKHIINLVTDKVVKNGAGAQVAETKTSYDSTALTVITGITQHDDTNYGTGNTVRGNPPWCSAG